MDPLGRDTYYLRVRDQKKIRLKKLAVKKLIACFDLFIYSFYIIISKMFFCYTSLRMTNFNNNGVDDGKIFTFLL